MRFTLLLAAFCCVATPGQLTDPGPEEVSRASPPLLEEESAEVVELQAELQVNIPPSARTLPVLSSPRLKFTKSELCDTAATIAAINNLPVEFFANLIQQESGFQTHVVSRAGAQGIAQFMPKVAASYGLADPFDPIAALTASGKLLADLVSDFGNVGLAAAAYNAGPKRIRDWMAKRRSLPSETLHYVQNITGRPAGHWASQAAEEPELKLPSHARCSYVPETAAQAIDSRPTSAPPILPDDKHASRGTRPNGLAAITRRLLPRSRQFAIAAPVRGVTNRMQGLPHPNSLRAHEPLMTRFIATPTPTIMVEQGASKRKKFAG